MAFVDLQVVERMLADLGLRAGDLAKPAFLDEVVEHLLEKADDAGRGDVRRLDDFGGLDDGLVGRIELQNGIILAHLVSCELIAVLGSGDDVILEVLGNQLEHLGVARHADRDVAVALGVLLRLLETLRGHDVPLELPDPHLHCRPDELCHKIAAVGPFDQHGVDLDDRGRSAGGFGVRQPGERGKQRRDAL